MMKNKNNYVIDDYEEWEEAYWDNTFKSLEECKIIFYNKEHFKKKWPFASFNDEVGKIKTYGDALLHKNNEVPRIRTLCKYILKGEIELYEEEKESI